MNRNFKRKLMVAMLAPALGLAVGSAMAQTTTGTTGTAGTAGAMNNNSWNAEMFDRLDKNKDGRISREEADADPMVKGSWSTMDSANRGSLSKDEFEKFRMSRMGVAGSSPPPNSATSNPNTTNPATTPSSGMPKK